MGVSATTVIVPRWEWRTFADELDGVDERLGGLTPGRVQESDETYVVSLAADASVKVRDGLLDVKLLQDVDEDGLEQWKPVLKAGYPIAAADVAVVLGALGAEVAPAEHDDYTREQLVELLGPDPGLRALAVHKRRVHYVIEGCMVERSEIRVGDRSRLTVAVESEDPALVTTTVHRLGLGARRNVNMARGLKALAGFGTHRYAAIDVGTNSVKFHAGELRPDGDWGTIADRAEVTRLGEGLDRTGELAPAAIERTVDAIAGMADEARRDGVEAIAAVGTAGLRRAANGDDLIAAARERAGVEVEVIGGEEEARLAYLAAKRAIGPGRGALVVFDSGGGSSQFTFGRGERVDERFSVDVGAVRIAERFGLEGAVAPADLRTALAAIAAQLSRLDDRPVPDALVGMGGAITNLTAVKLGLARYDPDAVQGTVLDRAEIDRQIELYRGRSAAERREVVGLQPNRAEVILAGACIVRTVLDKLGRDALTVSDRGLRHGLIAERFG